MTRSNRRVRRLALLVGALAIVAVTVAIVLSIRGGKRDHLVHEARAEGLVAYAQGDYDLALRKLSYYLSNERDDLEVLLAFADTRARVPRSDNRHVLEAIGLFHAALALDQQNEEALGQLLGLYERLGRRIEAMDIARQILQRTPENVDALRVQALGAYIDQQFDAAAEAVATLIELEPHQIEWRVLKLQIMRDQSVPLDELLRMCDEWIAAYDGDGRYHLVKAQVLAAAGQLAQAREAARKVAQLGADSADVLQQAVSLLDILQLRSESAELIAATKRRYPDQQWGYEAAVRRHWQGNRFHEALAELELAAEVGELERGLLRWKGLLLILTGQHDLAVEALATLEELAATDGGSNRDADRAWVVALRARLQWDEIHWPALLEAYNAAISLSPTDAVLHFLVGEAYMRVNEYELAKTSLERAFRSDPHWHAARIAYAESLLMTNQPDDAVRVLREAIQQTDSPSLASFLLLARAWLATDRPTDNLGLVEINTGRRVSLVEMLQRSYETDPDHGEVSELLVRVALRYGQDDVARDVIARSIEQAEADVRMLLAFIDISEAYGLGFAQQLLERAIEIEGMTPRVAIHRANMMHRQGDPDAGLALLDELVVTPERRTELLRVKAQFMSRIGHPETTRALSALLDATDAANDTPDFVLSQPKTWSDETLVERAIDALAGVVGEASPRVALARATRTLRFDADDPAELAKAQVLVDDVLKRMPNSASAQSLMAQLYLAGEAPNTRQAIRHLQRALTGQRNQPELYVTLITLLQQEGDFAQAERYLVQLSNLTLRDPDLQRAEVGLLEAQGDLDQVIARLRQRLDSDASETEKLMLVSRLHRAGRHADAQRMLDDILAAPNRSDLAVRLAAELYASTGRFTEGLSLIQSHNPAGGESQRALMLGRYYLDNGLLDDAATSFARAIELDPENVEAISQFAEFHLSMDDAQQAYDLARMGLQRDADNPALQATLITASLALGGHLRRDAMDLLNDSTQLGPALVDTLRVFDSITDESGAILGTRTNITAARRLVQDHPRYMPAWRLAVMVNVRANQMEEAIRLATQATTRMPHLAEPAQLATQLLVTAGRLPEARTMALTWRQRSLNRTLEPDLMIAAIDLDSGRAGSALSQVRPHIQQLIIERDRHPDRPLLLLQILLRADEIELARQHFSPLFDDSGYWHEAWLELAGNLDRAKAERAVEAVADAFATSPQLTMRYASAWGDLGRRFGESDMLTRADEYAQLAVAREDSLSTAGMLLRASNAESRGDDGTAEHLYREALSRNSQSVIGLNNLAYLLARSGNNCDEAATLVQRAVELAPNVPEILDTQAQVMLCLDEPQAAERSILAAIEMRPDSSDLLTTLGIVQATQRQWDDAARTLERAEQLATQQIRRSRALDSKLDRLRSMIERRSQEASAPTTRTHEVIR